MFSLKSCTQRNAHKIAVNSFLLLFLSLLLPGCGYTSSSGTDTRPQVFLVNNTGLNLAPGWTIWLIIKEYNPPSYPSGPRNDLEVELVRTPALDQGGFPAYGNDIDLEISTLTYTKTYNYEIQLRDPFGAEQWGGAGHFTHGGGHTLQIGQ
jgi:hypothetical protein